MKQSAKNSFVNPNPEQDVNTPSLFPIEELDNDHSQRVDYFEPVLMKKLNSKKNGFTKYQKIAHNQGEFDDSFMKGYLREDYFKNN